MMLSRPNYSASPDAAGNTRRRSLRSLVQNLFFGGDAAADPKRGRLLLESLEKRQLLAGDMELLFTDGGSSESQSAPAAESSSLQVATQAEGELAPDLVQFAKDLADAGVQFFGAHWCPACTQQKEFFDDGKDNLPFIEVTDPDRRVTNPENILNEIGVAEGIGQFPTWEFPDGSRLVGVQTLETLSDRSGVPIPQSEQPTFETVGNLSVQIGSPLHVPIDAYDPDGGPLTVTVSVADPSLLTATVLTGNRSIRIDMEGYGDMVFEMFEQRAPTASGRVIELASQQPVGFYDGIIFHRVDDDFVIQGGDPTGTGTSGSTLGTFDDDFHEELQHNRTGVLSFAKSSDDTNNSQFFITEVPTRFLDFNHSIIGQLVEGFDVREAISEVSTPSSRGENSSEKPDIDVVIETIEVFNDVENSVVMLKATGAATGSTDVTFTVTDQDGNSHSETVQVSVVNDTANSQPFLQAIPTPDTTPANTAAQLQLASIDVEGDPVTYFAQSLSSLSSGTVAVDSSTGLVTVTPATGFAGTINVQVGVEPAPGVIGNAPTDRDTQTVSFLFEGEGVLPPTSVDLQSGSDTGSSNIDNITNAGTLSFLVEGVTSGSTVQLINTASGSVVGTETAAGTTVVVTTNNIAALGDGTYQIAARQISGNDTSTLSPTLAVVYDSTAPDSVASSAATQANVGREYVADLISPEEGSGLIYALTSAPAGAVINGTTGVINWTPTASQTGSNTFAIELTDSAGNTRTEAFAVSVAGEPLAEVRLEVTNLAGTPISSVSVGENFLLNFFGVDARPFTQPGVFAAYADILFDGALIRPVASVPIDYDGTFTLVQKGTFETGLIDELGAVNSSLVATQERESLIATVRMEALASGTVNIRSEPADENDSEVLIYGEDDRIPAESVFYGSASLAIGQSFIVGDDEFTVAEDSGATTLDVLANDVIVSGGGTLSVVSVTQPPSGGAVTLSGGAVSFTPAADFNGEAVFTYRVSDTGGVQENATVTVTVTPVNDLPDGQSDTFNVDTDSADNFLDVLANDSIAPDSDETLAVIDVGPTSNGGVVSIAGGAAGVSYTPPAGFVGTDTFTYTLSDGGLTDLVNVTVTVAPADNPPTANNDAFTITEDDAEASFDVLANDQRDVDDQAFVIDSVGTPNQGGSARVSADGTQFFYTPAANFSGFEEVAYTIRDTGGGLSAATVTFTVDGVNDVPPILDPTVGLNRGSGESTVFELSDLPANVDSDETLTISSVDATTAAGGTARIDATANSILYTPPSDSFTGTDTVNYSISDGTLTSSGVITINVADFTERSIFVTLPSTSVKSRVNGVMLKGTNLLGESVAVPLAYNTDSAVFANLLPGDYMIEIPAIPFLQNASVPRQIPVTSGADDGDIVVDVEIGRLRPEYILINDFLGSTPRANLVIAVSPGETNTLAMQSSTADRITDPVVELNSTGESITIRGKDPASETAELEAVLPILGNPTVQTRGEIDGIRLFKISVEEEDVAFSSNDPDAGGEGEFVAPQSASLLGQPSSNTLSVGGLQAEGESIAAAGTTQADIFVPVANVNQTRSDALVLALDEGDLWLGESLRDDASSRTVEDTPSVDAAMQSVATDLTVVSGAAESIAEQNAADASLDQAAIDTVLSSDLSSPF